MYEVLVEGTRGDLVELIHRGHVAVVDATGKLLYSAGDPDKLTSMRSAAKPIQAIPIVESGAADHFGLNSEDLAIICSSHNSEPVHIDAVTRLLTKLELSEAALQCGTHPPFDRRSADEILRTGRELSPAYSNCSGKHTGMLALAAFLGHPLEGYYLPGHEVQRIILDTMSRVTEVPASDIRIGVDGCGVPVFGLPLRAMALAFARLADPEAMPEGKREAARRLRDAMLEHPYLVAGRNRICTALMQKATGKVVAKSGADGIYCVGVLPGVLSGEAPEIQPAGSPEVSRHRGIGIAVKIDDGSDRARHPAVMETLRQLGILTPEELEALAWYHRTPIKNFRGETVGELRPVFELHKH